MKPKPPSPAELTRRRYLAPFTPMILAPVRAWQLEADTNKKFYLGTKEFEYVATLSGHEPRCWFCDERNDYCQCEDGLF